MNLIAFLSFLLIAFGLYFLSQFNFVFFYTIISLFTVVISLSAFIIVLNVRRNITNNYLFFIGITFLFISLLDFLQLVTYEGLSVITVVGNASMSAQLWVATRFLQGLSLLIAPVFFRFKKFNYSLVMIVYTLVISLLVLLVFNGFIPDCNNTVFSRSSEYFISFMLIASIYLLRMYKNHFEKNVYVELSLGIFLSMICAKVYSIRRISYNTICYNSFFIHLL